MVVSYLPVGSEQATKWYVEQVIEAGCGFVNCIPVFIASENYWANRFRKAGLPIVGDDIKSQVGATILHRTLASLFQDRGVRLARTSQLNVGGNMDFFNMLERERLESKKISKTQAVTSLLDEQLPADDVYIGPSDYVPWLTDRKWAHIRLEGEAFGDVPLTLEAKLEVWDSPNSAGIVTDAVRCCKLALNHGIGGPLEEPSSYLMKSPPVQVPDSVAHDNTERFIEQYGGAPKLPGGEARIKVETDLLGASALSCSASRRAAHGPPVVLSGPLRQALILRLVAPDPLRIAQVTPYPWEQHHEVNRFVERLSDELCSRGHSVVVVAPSDSRELVREGRARIEEQSRDPDAVFGEPGCASLVAVGQSLPFRRGGSVALPLDVSRTLEDLLERTELDFVHVHEPFAPSAASAALRHSRALNVGSFHGATERFLSTQVARRVVELLFGRLDGRTASFTVTRELVERYFPGDYRADPSRAPTCSTAPTRRATGCPRSCSRPRRSAAPCGSSCARCGGCPSSSTGARRSGCATRPPRRRSRCRGGCATACSSPGRATARRRSTSRAPRSRWPPRRARRPRRRWCCARWPAGRCRWWRGCRSTRRRCATASSACSSSRATRSRSPASSSG